MKFILEIILVIIVLICLFLIYLEDKKSDQKFKDLLLVTKGLTSKYKRSLVLIAKLKIKLSYTRNQLEYFTKLTKTSNVYTPGFLMQILNFLPEPREVVSKSTRLGFIFEVVPLLDDFLSEVPTDRQPSSMTLIGMKLSEDKIFIQVIRENSEGKVTLLVVPVVVKKMDDLEVFAYHWPDLNLISDSDFEIQDCLRKELRKGFNLNE